MNPKKFNYKEVDKIAKSLGLKRISAGQHETKSGMRVDLTATSPERLCVLARIGQCALTIK